MQVSFANICFIINICIIPYMHFQHYSLRNKISFKISFQCSLKLFGRKVPWNFLQSSMELFEQHLNNNCGSMEFHGIPWNFVQIQSSMEFHGTFSTLPSSMEFHGTFNFPPKSSMEFHGIPWNYSCHRNWRTPSSMEFHGIPWNCSCQRNWRILSSMEFHGTAPVSKIGAFLAPWNSMELLVSAKWVHS